MAPEIDVFAEVEPRQKERIILALKKAGNVVGYLGDGVNDAAALHVADVGISVDTATDVLKEEADIVLLQKDLRVLTEGVEEGRRTFGNTLKYIFMATSGNFGNMFSTAIASFFLTFLPMLPKQILLNNLLTDGAEMTIASDTVDGNVLIRPQRWDLALIRKFMIVFGVLSALFDFATFAVLIFVLGSRVDQFRTAWFIESVASASMAVIGLRSRKSLFKGRPGKYMLIGTSLAIIAVLLIPYTQIGEIFGLVALYPIFHFWIWLIVGSYLAAIELTKRTFFLRMTGKQ